MPRVATSGATAITARSRIRAASASAPARARHVDARGAERVVGRMDCGGADAVGHRVGTTRDVAAGAVLFLRLRCGVFSEVRRGASGKEARGGGNKGEVLHAEARS